MRAVTPLKSASHEPQSRSIAALVASVVVSAGLLVAASLPYFTIQLGSSGVSSLPDGSSPKRAFTILEEEFNSGLLTPTKVVIVVPDKVEVRPTNLSKGDSTMTTATMALTELAEKGADIDVLRQMVQFAAQRLMEMEAESLCGAGYELVLVTPRGNAPSVDQKSVDPQYFGGDAAEMTSHYETTLASSIKT